MAQHSGYQTRSFSQNIRSLQAYNYNRQPNYPLIVLNSEETIQISFDDLGQEVSTYSYEIIHCDANWNPSEVSETAYLEGFSSGYISDYQTSDYAYFTYTHFALTLPNNDVQFLASGNYVVLIYLDNDAEKIVAQACFSVVENLVGIDAKASASTDLSYRGKLQQLSIEVDYSEVQELRSSNDVNLCIQQNQRKDNQVVNLKPTFFGANLLKYQNNTQLIFDAGSEFRNFDISSIRNYGNRVEKIAYYKPYYHATLYPDEIRSTQFYDDYPDVNGRCLTNLQESDYSNIEADYFFVHFSLPVEHPFIEGELHLLGELNNYRFDNNSRLKYNAETNAYEKILLLKQGGYDYAYAYIPSYGSKGSLSEIEGDFWKTNNEYAIYVYYRPFGAQYDRLIGFAVVSGINK